MGLRPLIIIPIVMLAMLPFMLAQQILTALNFKAARHLPQFYLALLCKILRVRVDISGPIPGPGPALLVGNHISWLDIPIIGGLFPASFVAKKEIGSWPVISHFAKLQGTVFVDRIRRQTVLKSRDQMQSRLKAGERLVLFPEGTSHTGKGILPFKSSLFSAVTDLDVPVIPFTLVFSHVRGLPITARQRPFYAWYGDMALGPHVWEALLSGPIIVKVIFHEAILPDTRKVMARSAHRTVRQSLAGALHPTLKIS